MRYRYVLIFLIILVLLYFYFYTFEKTNENLGNLWTIPYKKYKEVIEISDNDIKNKNIYVVWHITTMAKWKEIVNEQLNTILESGLYDVCKTIYYGCNGDKCDEKLKEMFKNYKKIKVLKDAVSYDVKTYEILTVNAMRNLDVPEDSYVLYIHTKGITDRNCYHHHWRKYMMNLMVTNYKKCIYFLNKKYLTVGPNSMVWKLNVNKHYSGNFFWSNINYIRMLDTIKTFESRYYAEDWILKKYIKNKHISFGEKYLNLKNMGMNKFKVDIKNNFNIYIF